MANDKTIKSTGIYVTPEPTPAIDPKTAAGQAELFRKITNGRRALLPRNFRIAMQIVKRAVKHVGGEVARNNKLVHKWRLIPPSKWPAKPHNAKEVFADAERLNVALACLRYAMHDGDIRTAVHEAMIVGKLTEKIRIRMPFEWPVLKYRGSRQGTYTSHEITYGTQDERKRRDDRIKTAIRELMSRNGNLRLHTAYIRLAPRFKLSPKSLERIYKKPC